MGAFSAIETASTHVAYTKSNTDDFPNRPRAIYVGGAGDVALVGLNDVVTIFTAVPVGTTLMVTGKRINSTSTTASAFVLLY